MKVPPVKPTGPPVETPAPAPRRRRRLAVAAVLLALLAFDLGRPPENQLSARAALGALTVYQATLSRLFAAAGVQCRFQPTCSRYAAGAIEQDGALIGSLRAVGRVVRCGPWTAEGTVDPPDHRRPAESGGDDSPIHPSTASRAPRGSAPLDGRPERKL